MAGVNTRRLLALADFLDKLPRKNFDWGVVHEQQECGTVACAIGWAPSVPCLRGKIFISTDGSLSMPVPAAGNYRCSIYEAAEKVFGLDCLQSDFLFGGYADGALQSDATAKQVARHIRKFVGFLKSNPESDGFYTRSVKNRHYKYSPGNIFYAGRDNG
jgi:hypothetical protein